MTKASEAMPVEQAEGSVGISVAELSAFYTLQAVKGFGPQKVKELFMSRTTPADLIRDPGRMPIQGKRGQEFRRQLGEIPPTLQQRSLERARSQIAVAAKYHGSILSFGHPLYPAHLFESSYPVPVLYARGNLQVLNDSRTVAAVGSRKIRPPYSELHRQFALAACRAEFAVISGFALGADSIGHRAAHEAGGHTVCVMPGGLDRPFPPENRTLWQEFLGYAGAAMVSEMPFGARASSLTLRRRNRLIVALARGVLVSQSSDKGGAMNAFRFALEQHKPVATFQDDGTADTSGNRAIVNDPKHPGFSFALSGNEVPSYEEWLRQLSSSI
jgi:DNA processing protein